MSKNHVELIYIGGEFYWNSKTMMSSLYTTNGERFDWGFVEVALQEGKTVSIRPATPKELETYKANLEELEKADA